MKYFVKHTNYLICTLCPRSCRILQGKHGKCGVRFNNSEGGNLPFYGILSAVNIDPIEKKPLYHFYPGSLIFSIGFYGCSFHCPFCQNFQISQQTPEERSEKYVSPEKLIGLVQQNNLTSVAFTYSEPLVHFEYILKASQLARENGIKTVLVTNGYLNTKPARELLPYIDALNIDLKSFSDVFYSRELGGALQPVLDFIKLSSEYSHVEVTTLVIPDKNDSDDELDTIAGFIASVDRNIPLHLSAYYPAFNYTRQSTKESTIARLTKRARAFLPFVYPGNTGGLNSNTYCPGCGELLIERHGYRISNPGIQDGLCSSCGKAVPFPV